MCQILIRGPFLGVMEISSIIDKERESYYWILACFLLFKYKSNNRLLDKICIQQLGKYIFIFKGMKAFQFLIKAKYNHKSWQKFEKFLHGTMLDLIRGYCEENWANPTTLGFLEK